MRIRIPTKAFIKDYLEHCSITRRHFAEAKLISIVLTNNAKYVFHSNRDFNYDSVVEIEISNDMKKHLSHKLHHRKIDYFNQIMSDLIRELLIEKIKTYMVFDKNIGRAINHARAELGIDDENYTDDALRKFYQRNRKTLQLPNIYNTNKAIKICTSNPPLVEQ